MNYVCRLYELCKSYEYFYESLKITSFFVFKMFLLIYKDGKPKLWKRKYWEKIVKKYVKEPIFKSKEKSFRIIKIFYRIER